jgi:hypothetical protein
MAILTNSVGLGGVNDFQDSKYVQTLLNDWLIRTGDFGIDIDGIVGDQTIGAIKKFQREALGFEFPDGLVEPGLNSIQVLQEFHITQIINGIDPGVIPHAEIMVAQLSQLEAGTSGEAAQLRLELENLPLALETAVREYLQALHDA